MKNITFQFSLILVSFIGTFQFYAQKPQSKTSEVWVSDLGNGTYKNPVLYADYSDPDVIRGSESSYPKISCS